MVGLVTSNDLIYYIDPTLEEGKLDTAVGHIGINDMLKTPQERIV